MVTQTFLPFFISKSADTTDNISHGFFDLGHLHRLFPEPLRLGAVGGPRDGKSLFAVGEVLAAHGLYLFRDG